MFEWSTYVVCPPATATVGENCEYLNDVMEYVFDLSSLSLKTYSVSSNDLVCLMLRENNVLISLK